MNNGNSSDFGAGLHESWQTSNDIRTADGHSLASFDPYFQVNFPSRYYDPALPGITGRPIDLCFLPVARARGGACQESIRNGAVAGIAYDDPRSAFNGVERFVDVNSIRIDNRDGPAVWYTNPFGRGGRNAAVSGLGAAGALEGEQQRAPDFGAGAWASTGSTAATEDARAELSRRADRRRIGGSDSRIGTAR